jgi:plastocyanin
MGRLLAIALAVAAAGIAVVAVNGPGKDKPEEHDALTPIAQSAKVSEVDPGGSIAGPGDERAEAAPVGATIVMRKLSFSPKAATVRPGQAIRFVNRDDVAHTVVQDFGPRSGLIPQFDSARIAPGDEFVVAVHSAGTIHYVCTLHPSVMTGRLTVAARA